MILIYGPYRICGVGDGQMKVKCYRDLIECGVDGD